MIPWRDGLKFDTFQHTSEQVRRAIAAGTPVVTLAYQGFCDPCRSTKPYVEELARKHGFPLIRVDCGFAYDPERAGENVPYIQVFRGEERQGCPLTGAHTAARIVEYLIEHGVLSL